MQHQDLISELWQILIFTGDDTQILPTFFPHGMENICIVADIQIRQIYYILGTTGIFIVAVIPTVPIFFTHGMASMYIGEDIRIPLISNTFDGKHLYRGRFTNTLIYY